MNGVGRLEDAAGGMLIVADGGGVRSAEPMPTVLVAFRSGCATLASDAAGDVASRAGDAISLASRSDGSATDRSYRVGGVPSKDIMAWPTCARERVLARPKPYAKVDDEVVAACPS